MRMPRQPRSPVGLNLTPMIDVVFQLLIFFVCTVEFQRQEEQLQTRLPVEQAAGSGGSRSREELDFGRIDVEVTPDEVIAKFQGQVRRYPNADSEAALGPLLDQLRAWTRAEPRIPVRLAGTADAPTGVILQVYDGCLQAGLQDVGLVNRP
jgi:biopolymer transport protein ExbD